MGNKRLGGCPVIACHIAACHVANPLHAASTLQQIVNVTVLQDDFLRKSHLARCYEQYAGAMLNKSDDVIHK